jgi:hypothetical protein
MANKNEQASSSQPALVTYTVEGDELVVRCPLTAEGAPSKSGKTRLVATSHGWMSLPDGASFSINVKRPLR